MRFQTFADEIFQLGFGNSFIIKSVKINRLKLHVLNIIWPGISRVVLPSSLSISFTPTSLSMAHQGSILDLSFGGEVPSGRRPRAS